MVSVLPIISYASEYWAPTKSDVERLDAFDQCTRLQSVPSTQKQFAQPHHEHRGPGTHWSTCCQ